MRSDATHPPSHPCWACGKPITRTVKVSPTRGQRFGQSLQAFLAKQTCSIPCRTKKQVADAADARKERGFPIKHCLGCGKQLVPKVYGQGTREALTQFAIRQHCNVQCEGRKRRLPEPSSIYSAGLYARRALAEAGLKISACAHCNRKGRKGNRLEVHHRDQNPFNNKVANLQVLCRRCHMRHHGEQWAQRPKGQCQAEGCTKERKTRFRRFCYTHQGRFEVWGHPLVRFNKMGKQLEGPPTKYRLNAHLDKRFAGQDKLARPLPTTQWTSTWAKREVVRRSDSRPSS